MFKTVERPFIIESMAYPLVQYFTNSYAFDGESHNFIELVYIQNGKAEVSENGKVYLLGDGNLIVHAPMEFHRIKSADGTEPTVYNLSLVIKGDVPEALYDGVFELESDERKEYMSIFNSASQFVMYGDSTALDGQQAASQLEWFIIDICQKNRKIDSLSSDAGALMYNKLVRTMKEHLYDNISLSELAASSYISVSYVKALFSRYAGTAPGNYFAKLRLNEAVQLIDKGIPIAQVSEMMNFSSPNYFSLFFKKQTGKTPTQYRKYAEKG